MPEEGRKTLQKKATETRVLKLSSSFKIKEKFLNARRFLKLLLKKYSQKPSTKDI